MKKPGFLTALHAFSYWFRLSVSLGGIAKANYEDSFFLFFLSYPFFNFQMYYIRL
jgi:hypothetical protein